MCFVFLFFVLSLFFFSRYRQTNPFIRIQNYYYCHQHHISHPKLVHSIVGDAISTVHYHPRLLSLHWTLLHHALRFSLPLTPRGRVSSPFIRRQHRGTKERGSLDRVHSRDAMRRIGRERKKEACEGDQTMAGLGFAVVVVGLDLRERHRPYLRGPPSTRDDPVYSDRESC